MVLDRFFGESNRPSSSFEKLDKDHQKQQGGGNELEDLFLGRFLAGPPAEMMSDFRRIQSIMHGGAGGAKVNETEHQFTVSMDVPGVKSSEMLVKLEDAMICINGQRTLKESNHTSSSRFNQCFGAASNLDASKATAELADGVLVVSAPKFPKQEVATIPITDRR